MFIVYAFYGYLSKLIFLSGSGPLLNLGDICSLVDGQWAYAVDLDQYETLTAANCFLAAVYWGVKGDFVDFWDAFLWLVAFVFIELNVVEWRQESAESQDFAVSSTT